MHIKLTLHNHILFEGFSTTAGEITAAYGDVTMEFPKVRALWTADVGRLSLKLHRDEFIHIGVRHRESVEASLVEIAELVSSGSSKRRLQERIQHWQRYWELSNQEILDFLQRVEDPLDILRREYAARAIPNRPTLFGLQNKLVHELGEGKADPVAEQLVAEVEAEVEFGEARIQRGPIKPH